MLPARNASARLRKISVIITSGAIVAAGLLVPASAYADSNPPQTQSGVLGGSSLSADGWTGPATDSANGYDFNLDGNGDLQTSNYGANGVITQLESPVTAEAGEPGYTDASYDSYNIAFTLDSAVTGDDKYLAQPDESLEIDADEGGNRAGGGLYLSVPADNTLELDNFSTTDPYGLLWTGTSQYANFTGPVTIDYTVTFVAGGPDVVTVKVNGTTVISTGAGTFEGYSFAKTAFDYTQPSPAMEPDHDKVDQVLLRATRTVADPEWNPENTDPTVAPWTDLPGTAPQGSGFVLSALSYGAQNSASQAYAFTSADTVAENQIANFEDANPSSPTFNYTNWHIGSNSNATDPNEYFNVLSNGQLQLNDYVVDLHSTQLLKGIPTADQPTDLYPLVAKGLAWTDTTAAPATYQIALTGANVAHSSGDVGFTTLHPESETETGGLNVVKLSDPWVSTHAIGSIGANTVEPLGVLLAALEPGVAQDPDAASTYATAALASADVNVIGFGVASEADHTTAQIGAIYFNGVKYTFSPRSAIALTKPTITGTTAVGHTLTAASPVDPADAALSYQWYRNGVAISGAKSQSYTATKSDYEKKLSVKVTARLTGYITTSSTSAKTAYIGKGTITATGSVTIIGVTEVGMRLGHTIPVYDTTDLAGNDGSGVTYTYQWLRGTAKIAGATYSTYVLTAADLGQNISQTVTAHKTDYSSLAITSAATAAIDPGVLGVTAAPTISGTAKSGHTLTATSGGWTADGVATTHVTKRYFWFVSDGSGTPDISDLVQVSSSNKLTLGWWAKGLKVSVYVVGVKDGYTSATSSFSAFTPTIQ